MYKLFRSTGANRRKKKHTQCTVTHANAIHSRIFKVDIKFAVLSVAIFTN